MQSLDQTPAPLREPTLPGDPTLIVPRAKHPAFDLLLHTDSQLEAHLGSRIAQRTTLHEWPLSCVQKLELEDGRKLVYKSQAGPTLEDEFYARASSAILPRAETLHRSPGSLQLLLEHIDAPHLACENLSDAELHALAQSLTLEIGKIQGELPCFRNLGSPERWSAFVDDLEGALTRLSAAGKLTHTTPEIVSNLLSHARAPEMLALFATPAQLLHSDLKSANVLAPSDGPKVIDWQFPRFGPPAIDHAIFIEMAGRDAAPLAGQEAKRAMYLIRIEWFAQCAERWFPDGAAFYDQEISRITREKAL